MANFFTDVVKKFKIIPDLIEATAKAGKAKTTAAKTDKLLQERPKAREPISAPKFIPEVIPAKSLAPKPREANTTVFGDKIDREAIGRSPVNFFEDIVEKLTPVQIAARMQSGESFIEAAKNAPGFGGGQQARIDRRIEVSQKLQSEGLSKEEASKKAAQTALGEMLVADIAGITDSGAGLFKKSKVPPIEGKPFTAAEYVQELAQKQELARKSEKKGVFQKVKDFYSTSKAKLIDSNAPIEDTLHQAQSEFKFSVLPEADITNQIDRTLRAPTLAGQFARDNGLEAVIKQADDLDNLDQYLIAKHANKVAERGIETGRELLKDRQLIEEFAPQYEPLARVVTDYSRKLLDYATDSELISKELAVKLKELYPDYVPLNRIFNELEQSGTFGTKAVASLSKQTVVQKLEGSLREIESPTASLLAKTNDVFVQGEKNKAAKILAGYEKLPGNPFQLRELKSGESAKHTISFIDNGAKRTFETTQEVAQAAKALNVQQLNILGKTFALPVRLAKLGITGINLPFVGANIVRDQLFALVTSKNTLKTSVANPIVFVRSLFAAVKHDKLYQELVRQGAGGTSFDIARDQVTQTVSRIRASRSVASKIKYTITHPSELLRAIEDIIGRSEELTRLQQFEGTRTALLGKGRSLTDSTIEAAKAARENTANFYRRGEWGPVLNSAFLYLNASVQGSRALIRAFERAPIQTSAKIATTLFLPVAIATSWSLSDPERKKAYEDIPDYEKEGNLIIIPPNPTQDENGKWNIIKLPLPPGLSSLAIPIRRAIEQVHGLDAVTFKEFASAIVGSISPIQPDKGSIISSLTPQAIKPTLEAVTNENFFTGLPQVPKSMEGLSPQLQARANTSGSARIIGGVLDASPIKVEEFIKGTFGGVGSQLVNLSDRVLSGVDIIPKNQIGGQNVIDAIAARFTKARGGELEQTAANDIKEVLKNQADERFRLKQEAELLFDELKILPKEEANARAREIKNVNPQLFGKLKETIDDAKLGLTYSDRLTKQLGVENGERAKFIWTQLQQLSTKEQKNSYIKELREKKVISEQVLEQLKKLKSQ